MESPKDHQYKVGEWVIINFCHVKEFYGIVGQIRKLHESELDCVEVNTGFEAVLLDNFNNVYYNEFTWWNYENLIPIPEGQHENPDMIKWLIACYGVKTDE